MQPFEHPLLLARQVGEDAMQKQRGLVEEPLRRFDALHHHAARQRMQLRVLLCWEFAARKHDNGNVSQLVILADVVEDLEPWHIRQPQVEHHAVAGVLAHGGQRRLAGIGNHDFQIVVAEKFGDAQLLRRVVFNDE